MTRLSAFVGHSFVDEDKEVTSRLLRVLTSISDLMQDFEWESAELAEPKALSIKVREKMKGKNLFIGICTAREATIELGKLRRRSWPNGAEVVAAQVDCQSKTSDWIIQEIGMAVGRDMQIILLLEEGLRAPGGLQGDLEYIPFSRREPEKCIDKLSSMLRSLSPKIMPASDAKEPSASSETDVPESRLGIFEEYLKPDESWNAETYASRLHTSIVVQEKSSEAKIEDAFALSPFAKDPAARAAFRATAITARAESYKEAWLLPLRQLSKEYPDQPAPLKALAEQFAASDDHERASKFYEEAAGLSSRPLDKVEAITLAATQQLRAKNSTKAQSLLASCAELVRRNPEIEANAMQLLASAWKELGNDQMFIACAERCLEVAPDLTQPRFELAHKYSELGQEAHALFHYRHYVRSIDDAGGWNNLGVSAAQLKLRIAAIDAYERSEVGGNTLATSNLAYAQLRAGFVDKAMAMCREALGQSDPSPRIAEALAACQGAREEERKKEDELLAETNRLRGLRRAMGRASISMLAAPFPKKWKGPNCELVGDLSGTEVRLSGSFERSKYGALERVLGHFKADQKETVTVEYAGQLFGLAFVGKVKTNWPGKQNNLLTAADDGVAFIGSIDPSGGTIEIVEGDKKPYALIALE